MLALTLLILGAPLRFLDLALLAAVYSAQFLLMAAVSDYLFGFLGALVSGTVLTGVLTYLLFRGTHSKLLRRLIYLLVGFFALVYPLAGLLTEVTYRNTFDNLVQVILILYLFGISLYARRSQTANSDDV